MKTRAEALCPVIYTEGKEHRDKMVEYDFKKIEKKWQDKRDEANAFAAENGSDKEKFYALIEFPYPSGQ